MKISVYDYYINGTPVAVYDTKKGVVVKMAKSMPFYNTAGGLVHEASDWQDCELSPVEFAKKFFPHTGGGEIKQEGDFLYMI